MAPAFISACQSNAKVNPDSTALANGAPIAAETRPLTTPSDSPRVVLRLIDSIPYTTEVEQGVLHRIELRRGARADTLRHIRTRLPAVIADDSVIHGFLFDSLGGLTHAFRFSVQRQHLDSLSLPRDLNTAISEPAFSPDGRQVAYVTFDSMARGVVRRWPSLVTLLETPALAYSAGDMLAGTAQWHDANGFTIYIDPFNDGSNRWTRFRGRIGSPEFDVDTIQLDVQH